MFFFFSLLLVCFVLTLSCPLFSLLLRHKGDSQACGFFLRGSRETVLSLILIHFLLLFFSIMEDLAANWNNLSLSEKEQKGFIMRTDHQTGEYMLAAYFLTPRFLLMDAMARTFK